ncbi:serine/threonine protein kinase [Coemansia sp. RSA 989]|nr:serine/threonine protein kinase [Coemansia sp. RSA 989]KAJ1873378.1 serine/threonine protein kinase [Coemansia sp. RSA 990]KAJ2671324.1 serine/threonine protein kinase [Coemansia sp. RSA 1085]
MASTTAPTDSQEMDALNQLFQSQLLVNQVPRSVWGVLLSLSPDDYKTVLLERTKSHQNGSGNEANLSSGSRSTSRFGYVIGRHRLCDIRIQNPHISNRHCVIYRIESEGSDVDTTTGSGRVYLEDTSTNGTYVGGQRVTRNASIELRDGDEIQLVRFQPNRGMEYFNDRFYVFQNLDLHRSEPCLFKQNYFLDKKLGSGAFAEVRIAINRVTGERFAAKIINRNRITQIEKRKKLDENFRIETSILSRVRHPAIVQVHGVFRETDYLYLVLDLASDGELFDEIVSRQYLSEDDSRRVLLQLLLSIRHLHRMGIVHRDIKLENILLADKQKLRLKLADFGLAKIVGEQTFMKTVCGTPMYVAPEVLTVRQAGMYDNLVDIWSLGVVLYICLCGFPPFSDELAPPPMRDQIIAGMYSFPSDPWDRISPDAIDLVCRMLQVDPRNRITVDQALAHPWLRARRIKGGWSLDGLDFVVADPDAVDDSQRTQSVSAESSQLNSAGRASRSALSPLSPLSAHGQFPKHPLPPSSPPFANADRQDSEIIFAVGSASDSETRTGKYAGNIPVDVAEAENDSGSSRKRKDPSFMRSQSDLGDMALPKRPMHATHSPESHHSPNRSPGKALDNSSGPLVMFDMSPDMCDPSHNSSGSNGSGQGSRNAGAPRSNPLLIYPKPLPRPSAPTIDLPSYRVLSPASKPFGINAKNAAGGNGNSSQHTTTIQKPLPTFFDFTRRP